MSAFAIPSNPNRYFLSRSRSPELVEVADIYEFDLDLNRSGSRPLPMYSERVIHGEIYKARPDVMAVCHHHSPAMLSYCITGEKLVPVFHLGAVMGQVVPFWDQREEFGDTNMLVQKPEEGASLARALGQNTMVLMNRHGATVGRQQFARTRVPHDLLRRAMPNIRPRRSSSASAQREPARRPAKSKMAGTIAAAAEYDRRGRGNTG